MQKRLTLKRFLLLVFITTFIGCSENPKLPNDKIQKESMVTKPHAHPPRVSSKVEKNSAPKINFPLDDLMGKIDPETHKDFIEMSTEHASKKKMFLRKEAYDAFKKMYEAAKKDGISLKILSATRPFNHQKSIWEAKWSGERLVGGKKLNQSIPDPQTRALKILEFSSMPGTSRHHWGTDIDINAFENSYFSKGKGKQEYEWLQKHAASFGFCQPYTPKGEQRPFGYNEEKWHWTYMPIATILTQKAKDELKDEMIKGFKGAETAPAIEVVRKYILGISKDCL